MIKKIQKYNTWGKLKYIIRQPKKFRYIYLLMFRNKIYDYFVKWFLLKTTTVAIKEIHLGEYNPYNTKGEVKFTNGADSYDYILLADSIKKYGVF